MAVTQMLKGEYIPMNGKPTAVMYYEYVEPQLFDYYLENANTIHISEPTRNYAYTFPNLPTLLGDYIFKISDGNGRLTGMFAGLPDDVSTFICTFGQMKLYARYRYAHNDLYLRFTDENDNLINEQNVSYVYPAESSETGSRNAFLIFLPVEYNNSQYILPYYIESNPFWFGHLGPYEWYDMRYIVPVETYGQDPYETAPDSEPDGGFGDFDYSGDPALPPDLPTVSVTDSGFVTLYKPTISQLRNLASYMWSGLFDVDTFKKLFADPMDCIISLSIIPVDAPDGGPREIKVGNIGTGINSDILAQQFVKVKFQTKNIGLRANNFADYSPYTKCQLFLPYVGCQSLNIDDIAGADIDIEYHIDLFSGSCTAYVTCTKRNSDGSTLHSTLYQFTGNVVANIPFTATNFQSFISSMIGTVVKSGAAVAAGGGLAGVIGSAINTAMSMKPDVERSGNLSSTSGFLGIQKPYLILTYPNLCIPDNRDKTVGTPSFMGLGMTKNFGNRKLENFHGLTILHKVNVENIPCTEAEKEMIAAQLTGEGVIMP